MAIADTTCMLTGWSGHPLICPFFLDAARYNLGAVVTGGLFGGLLQPIYARLDHNQLNPTVGNIVWSALLGVAAAGISVYVLANSKTDEAVRLLFFAFLSGLTFPTVLAQALRGNHAPDVQKEVVEAAKQAASNDLNETAQAADQLNKTLARNPADGFGLTGVSAVAEAAQLAVRNIADTANSNPRTAAGVINQLQQVGAVAKSVGYASIVNTAAEELDKMQDRPIDEAIKSLALNAADGLRGV